MRRGRVTSRKSYGGRPPRRFLDIPTMKDTITTVAKKEIEVFVRASSVSAGNDNPIRTIGSSEWMTKLLEKLKENHPRVTLCHLKEYKKKHPSHFDPNVPLKGTLEYKRAKIEKERELKKMMDRWVDLIWEMRMRVIEIPGLSVANTPLKQLTKIFTKKIQKIVMAKVERSDSETTDTESHSNSDQTDDDDDVDW